MKKARRKQEMERGPHAAVSPASPASTPRPRGGVSRPVATPGRIFAKSIDSIKKNGDRVKAHGEPSPRAEISIRIEVSGLDLLNRRSTPSPEPFHHLEDREEPSGAEGDDCDDLRNIPLPPPKILSRNIILINNNDLSPVSSAPSSPENSRDTCVDEVVVNEGTASTLSPKSSIGEGIEARIENYVKDVMTESESNSEISQRKHSKQQRNRKSDHSGRKKSSSPLKSSKRRDRSSSSGNSLSRSHSKDRHSISPGRHQARKSRRNLSYSPGRDSRMPQQALIKQEDESSYSEGSEQVTKDHEDHSSHSKKSEQLIKEKASEITTLRWPEEVPLKQEDESPSLRWPEEVPIKQEVESPSLRWPEQVPIKQEDESPSLRWPEQVPMKQDINSDSRRSKQGSIMKDALTPYRSNSSPYYSRTPSPSQSYKQKEAVPAPHTPNSSYVSYLAKSSSETSVHTAVSAESPSYSSYRSRSLISDGSRTGSCSSLSSQSESFQASNYLSLSGTYASPHPSHTMPWTPPMPSPSPNFRQMTPWSTMGSPLTMFSQSQDVIDRRYKCLQQLHSPPRPNFYGHQLIGDSMLLRFSHQILAENSFFQEGIRFIGYCVSGQTVGDLLKRLRSNFYHIGKKVVLMIGTNDLLKNTPIDQMLAQLQRVVDLIKSSAQEVIILTLPPVPRLQNWTSHWKRLSEYNAAIKKLANEDKGIFVSDISPLYCLSQEDIEKDDLLAELKTDAPFCRGCHTCMEEFEDFNWNYSSDSEDDDDEGTLTHVFVSTSPPRIKIVDHSGLFTEKRLQKCRLDFFELEFSDSKRKDLIHLNFNGLKVVKEQLSKAL